MSQERMDGRDTCRYLLLDLSLDPVPDGAHVLDNRYSKRSPRTLRHDLPASPGSILPSPCAVSLPKFPKTTRRDTATIQTRRCLRPYVHGAASKCEHLVARRSRS